MARLLQYLLASATAFIMLHHLSSQFKAQAMTVLTVDDEVACILGMPQPGMEPQYSEYLPRYDRWRPELRVEFARGPGGFVRGWPSKGGLYALGPCLGVELEFLGLDRFHNTPRPSISDPTAAAEEEETHCNKMRQLGATWFKNEHEYMKHLIYPDLTDMDFTFHVGWPAGGGVWVLTVSRATAKTTSAAIIHNAFNMEERCKAIEQLGGRFYENPKDCRSLDLP
ncbi:hypothetical protein J3F83DRAFT_749680 [Trichoderma novae-zelandiae]